MNCGIVLCAGFGTRLRPVTEVIPKPAVPFLGHPMVWYALRSMKDAGISVILANVHHLPDRMSSCLRASCMALGLGEPRIYVESGDILGTAGGSRACLSMADGASRFVIYHGDVLCGADLGAALESHVASGASVSLVVAPRPPGCSLGMVGLCDGQIVRIRDWVTRGYASRDWDPVCFTGIHIVERHILESVPPLGYSCLVTQVYPRLMSEGRPIHACLTDRYFADIGTPQTYFDAQDWVVRHPEVLPDANVSRAVSSWSEFLNTSGET